MGRSTIPALVLLAACGDPAAPTASTVSTGSTDAPQPSFSSPPASAAPAAAPSPTSSPSSSTASDPMTVPDPRGAELPSGPDVIPPGSGDYAAVLALATRYRRKEIDWPALVDAILARKLPPHPLGDGYLFIRPPPPPPPQPFEPRRMPEDWEGTWGEVAMATHLARLSRAEHDALHALAHPACPPIGPRKRAP